MIKKSVFDVGIEGSEFFSMVAVLKNGIEIEFTSAKSLEYFGETWLELEILSCPEKESDIAQYPIGTIRIVNRAVQIPLREITMFYEANDDNLYGEPLYNPGKLRSPN